MRVCGVELKGNEAIVCLLSESFGMFQVQSCRVNKIAIQGGIDSESIQAFQFAFKKLMEDYTIDAVVIRERPLKGKFAGGAIGFKMEAAIQLIDGLDVELLSSSQIKKIIKKSPPMIDFKDTGLKQFQEPSFSTAFAYINALTNKWSLTEEEA